MEDNISEQYPSIERLPELLVDRHDEQILNRLATAPLYKKRGEIKAVVAQGGERVVTTLPDGTVETENTALPGDAIVTNPGGEQYIVDASMFAKRYKPKPGEEGVYTAAGYCRAVRNFFGQPISILASWGEKQRGAADCLIADTFNTETGQLDGEPYLIAAAEFEQTYRLAGSA